LLAPLALIGLLAAGQLWAATPALREPMMMGASASVCPWCILATAIPLFAALVWAIRDLAGGVDRLQLLLEVEVLGEDRIDFGERRRRALRTWLVSLCQSILPS